MSCSEFASMILREASVFDSEQAVGVLLTMGVDVAELDPELFTPGALERFCAGSDGFWVM